VELSLRSRQSTAVRPLPDLRVWPAGRLRLHEEADAARVRRLVEALRRDGVLRNPPVVAPLAGGDDAVVLDGANRVTALRELGLPHAVVQVVRYDDPAVRLGAWRHYAVEDSAGALRAAAVAAGLGPAAAVDDEAEAEARLAAGGLAAVVDARGGVVLGGPAGPVEQGEALRRLTALYRDGRAVHRVDTGTLDELRPYYGSGALVLFRRFAKADILRIAAAGGRLPAGVTRHVIPGRALRLNTPLAWLADGIEPSAKQAALDAQLQQRWQAHGVRYYAEPAFLFDE
jgi:hypothetical protein